MTEYQVRALNDFSNTPGNKYLKNIQDGQIVLQQADGVLLTRHSDGTQRETPLYTSAELQNKIAEEAASKLDKSANLSDLTNKPTARASIGLGNVDDLSATQLASPGNPVGDILAQTLRPSDPLFNAVFSAAVAAWMASLPVASSNPDDPAPVPSGQPYKLGPGGPVVIAQ